MPVYAFGAAISLLAAGISGAALAGEAGEAGDAGEADSHREGSIILDARARIEVVDDADVTLEKGRASTFRLRAGYETAEYGNFRGLVEGEFVQRAGMVTFNDSINGKTGYALVADPNVAQLNRAQITYTGIPDTTIVAGRQRIILDDGRFVGNDGFRQNEQTFDAVRITNNSFADFTASYIFIGGVNRTLGGKSEVGRFTGQSHLVDVAYSGLPIGTVTLFTHFIDLDEAPLLSSQTHGIRVAGTRQPFERLKINYGFVFATQRDYGDNPQDFDLGYFMGELGAAWEGTREAIALTARIEWLDGGTFRGFSTPLGSLHDFQGFTDRFTNTPGIGVEDIQLIADYDMKDLTFAKNLRFSVWYHNYSSITDDSPLGREVNLALTARFNDRLSLKMQYADFNADDGGPERDGEIIWVALEYKY